MILDDKSKFEALIHRHSDMSNLLQVMQNADLRIFFGFLTLQFAFGSFISQIVLTSFGKIGLFIIDLGLAFTCFFLLRNHNERRSEVVETLKNCNKALGYEEIGYYIKSKALNSSTKRRPWLKFYVISNIITVFGIGLILFFGNPKPDVDDTTKLKPSTGIEQSVNDTIVIKKNK